MRNPSLVEIVWLSGLILCCASGEGAELFTLEQGFATDVSADGSSVLVYSNGAHAIWRPRAGTVTSLPTNVSTANGISADGSAVVGSAFFGGLFREAYRWTEPTGLMPLGGGFFGSSEAWDFSADASVVFGRTLDEDGETGLFRWSDQTGTVPLDILPTTERIGIPVSVSDDGSVIIGNTTRDSPVAAMDGFRSTEKAGVILLQALPQKPFVLPWEISADGSTIIGWAQENPDDGSPREAFRWTEESGTVGLGVLPGSEASSARVVSADGKLVLGVSASADGDQRELFAWSESSGMVSLADVFVEEFGVQLVDASVDGMSADSRTIVGSTQDRTADGSSFSRAWAIALEEPLQNLLPSLLQGDYDGNGTVEQGDLDLVLLNWGRDATAPPSGWSNDLPSGPIDQGELDRVLLNWGGIRAKAVAPGAVSEPATAVLIFVSMVVLLLSKRLRTSRIFRRANRLGGKARRWKGRLPIAMGRHAVTLVELLVVITIIGVVMTMVIPAVQSVREAARRAQCQSHLRQVALAIESFHDARGRYPEGRFFLDEDVGPDGYGWSWIAKVFAYLEEDAIYKEADIPWSTLGESGVIDRQIPLLLCPSDGYSQSGPRSDAGNFEGTPVGQTNYKAVSGANWGADATQDTDDIGTLFRHRGMNGSFDGYAEGDGIMWRHDHDADMRHAKVVDGLSKTFLLGEDLPEHNTWCSWPYVTHVYGTCAIPPNFIWEQDPGWWPNTASFRSAHPGGLYFALADGSVHWVAEAIDLDVYRALATRAGAEVVEFE